MSEAPTMTIGEGNSAVMSHTLVKRIPVNYTPGAQVMYGNVMLYDVPKTIRDNDMKVFLCILKAYTDNKHKAMTNLKDKYEELSLKSSPLDFTGFTVDTRDISRAVYPDGNRKRATRLMESLRRMAGIKIYLVDGKGEKMGFVQLVSGAQLSTDKNSITVGINKDFLIDMSKVMIQYSFKKMTSLYGLDFRLFIAMQQRKYLIRKGRYGYTNIENQELMDVLNIHSVNAKYRIAEAFQNIGINFVLGRNNKWFYPKNKIVEEVIDNSKFDAELRVIPTPKPDPDGL